MHRTLADGNFLVRAPLQYLILSVFSAIAAPRALAFDGSYWVWQRATALTPDETAELDRQHIAKLYWEVGEIAFQGGRWTWISQPVPRDARNPSRFHVIPVVQIIPNKALTLPGSGLIPLLKSVAESGELQIDCDCPDRLLYRYGEFLGQLHQEVPRLTFTALAHWIHHPAWQALECHAEEVLPMFYDLYPDPPNAGENNPPQPLLGSAESQMEAWHQCGIRWQAGLPTFVRVTLYDSDGRSCGHIRDWSWDEICFQKALRSLGPARSGTVLFAVDENLRLSLTPLPRGSLLAIRCAAREAIVQAAGSARRLGAEGVVYFRMPDGSDPSGWSLRQAGQFLRGDPFTPRLSVRMSEGQQIELANRSDADLAPRLLDETETGDRGYALEIDAGAPVFREAEGGEFWRVAGCVLPDKNPRPAGIPLATRLTFRFSHLRAGEVLRTGLVQLAPGVTPARLRYRVLGTGENLPWKSFD